MAYLFPKRKGVPRLAIDANDRGTPNLTGNDGTPDSTAKNTFYILHTAEQFMRRPIYGLLIGCLLQILFVPTISAQSPSPRKQLRFDDDWKFSLGHAADPAKDFNFRIAGIF